MQPKLLDGYLTPDQLAAEFGCCVETLKRWKRAGEGPPVTYIGRYPTTRGPARWPGCSRVIANRRNNRFARARAQEAAVQSHDDLLIEIQKLVRATRQLAAIDSRYLKLARLVGKAYAALFVGDLTAFENTSAAAVDESRRLKLEICN